MCSGTSTFQSTRHMSHAIYCPVLLLLPTAHCRHTVIAETGLDVVMLMKTLRTNPECA